MTNPMDLVFLNFNKNYQRITQERKPAEKKLKNVTPVDEQLECDLDFLTDVQQEMRD